MAAAMGNALAAKVGGKKNKNKKNKKKKWALDQGNTNQTEKKLIS
jgi:hypothetical protein